jgi:hypothetical protein
MKAKGFKKREKRDKTKEPAYFLRFKKLKKDGMGEGDNSVG